MLRRCVILALCVLVLSGSAAAQTLEEVLEGYYEARGGLDKLKAIETIRMTGKMATGGGMEIPMVMEQKRPDMSRSDFTFQGATGTTAFDGEIAWSLMPFQGKDEPEELPAEQTERMKEEADFDGVLVDWEKKGLKLELMGTEEVEGTEAHKIKVTRKSGDVDYYYLDAEYYMPIKLSGKRKMGETEMEFEVYPGDYKEVDGVMFPFSIETRAPGGGFSRTLTLEKIELNVEIDDSRFKMPAVEKAEGEEEKKEEKEGEKKEKEDSGP